MKSDLLAAGIYDPHLKRGYEACRRLNAEHGRTYYLATLLLPPAKRPYVHALYGLARYADDIVDTRPHATLEERAVALHDFREDFTQSFARGSSENLIVAAAIDTAARWRIDFDHFDAFFDSMNMDLTTTSYETYEDLYSYMYGSAAVIGLQMVPILEPVDARAYQSAVSLGVAFQLANFIRDVGEDLDRGRIYLPLAELREYGISPVVLERRHVTPELKAALRFQVDRVKRLQTEAEPGIAFLSAPCRPCIQTASTLYCGIAEQVERNDYQIFDRRAKVSTARRLRVAVPAALKARRACRGLTLHPEPAPKDPQGQRQ